MSPPMMNSWRCSSRQPKAACSTWCRSARFSDGGSSRRLQIGGSMSCSVTLAWMIVWSTGAMSPSWRRRGSATIARGRRQLPGHLLRCRKGGAPSIALGVELENGGVVHQSVDGGDGHRRIREDLYPGAERLVAGDDQRAPLVALGDQFEQHGGLGGPCGRSRDHRAPGNRACRAWRGGRAATDPVALLAAVARCRWSG